MDMESSIFSMDMEEAVSSKPYEQEATVKIFIPSVQCNLIEVSSEWFSSYITAETGQIHDYCIAEYDSGARTVKLLGSYTVSNDGANQYEPDNDICLNETLKVELLRDYVLRNSINISWYVLFGSTEGSDRVCLSKSGEQATEVTEWMVECSSFLLRHGKLMQ